MSKKNKAFTQFNASNQQKRTVHGTHNKITDKKQTATSSKTKSNLEDEIFIPKRELYNDNNEKKKEQTTEIKKSAISKWFLILGILLTLALVTIFPWILNIVSPPESPLTPKLQQKN